MSLSRLLLTAGTLGLLTLSSPAVLAATGSAEQSLSVEQFEQAASQAEGRDQARLDTLLSDREALQAAVSEAEARRDSLRETRATLEAEAQEQQATLSGLDEERQTQQGDLGQVFEVTRKHARETREALAGNWLLVGGQARLPDLGPRDECRAASDSPP